MHTEDASSPEARTADALSRRTFLGLAGGALALGRLDPDPLDDRETRPAAVPPGVKRAAFRSARPVWLDGREREMNLFTGFRTVFSAGNAPEPPVLRLAGSTAYRIYLNGEFLAYGPARGPHGFFRVDTIPLPNALLADENLLAIEVVGYNVNTYYTLNQPSFLQAEIAAGGAVLASTGGGGAPFRAAVLPEKVRRVQRYSFQRPFVEVYRLEEGFDAWRLRPDAAFEGAEPSVLPDRRLLPRRVPMPDFALRAPRREVAEGNVRRERVAEPWRDRSLNDVGPAFLGFPEEALELVLSTDLQGLTPARLEPSARPYEPGTPVELPANGFRIFDFGTNLSGFVGLRVRAEAPVRLFLAFDEILTDGDVDFTRLSCVSAVLAELEPGTHRFETFEPYTLRYLKLIAEGGACTVEAIHLREYAAPDVYEAHFAAADPRLNRLFEAGRETYRQNAVDVFSDCPSRERAGWLCDSFFTARAAAALTRHAEMERVFFENYALPERFEFLPDGMLPMCYPADHNDGVFIPNWSLWFVLQLEEYLARTGDRPAVDALAARIDRLFDYFEGFRNEDGLLESLEGWVFVEWSEANAFVQDVNYPSNMLYAAALAAAGRLYDRPGRVAEAGRIRATIREQAFDGTFFVDHAVRRNGALTIQPDRTEVCQYFAFFFDVATPDSHPALWQTLRDAFGPGREAAGAYPDVHPANAFVGNMLRLELLARAGLGQQVLDESIAYLLYMAERTGTLWENIHARASCNHGFASHIVHALYRDVLGCRSIDPVGKVVRLAFTDVDLPWCEGLIPTGDGFIRLRWEKKDGAFRYEVDVPAGYTVEVENGSGMTLERL